MLVFTNNKHYIRLASLLREKTGLMKAYYPKEMKAEVAGLTEVSNPTYLITDLTNFCYDSTRAENINILMDSNFDTSNVAIWDGCFQNVLRTEFPPFLDISGATSVTNMFSGTTNMQTIGFVPECIKISGLDLSASTKLTAASIESIIDGLDISITASRTIKLNSKYETDKVTKTLVESLDEYSKVTAAGWTIIYI